MEEGWMISAIVIGGSAGSLQIILHLLPVVNTRDTPPIVIVLHRKGGDGSSLTGLLAGKTKLRVKEAEDKEQVQKNTVYIAPADYHLLIENDFTFALDYSEKVNYSRPSIDVTFQTAAEAYGKSLTAVLLSGASSDGAEGLEIVKKAGGLVIVQDPKCAEVAYMPQQALDRIDADYLVNTDDKSALGTLINLLVSEK